MFYFSLWLLKNTRNTEHVFFTTKLTFTTLLNAETSLAEIFDQTRD